MKVSFAIKKFMMVGATVPFVVLAAAHADPSDVSARAAHTQHHTQEHHDLHRGDEHRAAPAARGYEHGVQNGRYEGAAATGGGAVVVPETVPQYVPPTTTNPTTTNPTTTPTPQK